MQKLSSYISVYVYLDPPKTVCFQAFTFLRRRPKTQLYDTTLASFCVAFALCFASVASRFQRRRALRQHFRGYSKRTSLQGPGI